MLPESNKKAALFYARPFKEVFKLRDDLYDCCCILSSMLFFILSLAAFFWLHFLYTVLVLTQL